MLATPYPVLKKKSIAEGSRSNLLLQGAANQAIDGISIAIKYSIDNLGRQLKAMIQKKLNYREISG